MIDNSLDNIQTKPIYYIDGKSLTPKILQQIVSKKLQIQLSQQSWNNVIKSRKIIKQMMSDPKTVVYGINTGFGNFADRVIEPTQREQLQRNLVRSHAVGVGQPLDNHIVKKMMVLRINTLAKGKSGIDPVNLKKIINAYNKNLIPMIPEKGTVGASGDLAPLSHLALGLMGEGKAWDDETQQFIPNQDIIKKKHIQPIQLHEKQGLALINGTQFMTSIISQISANSQTLLQSAIVIYAFAVQIFGLDFDFFCKQSIDYYQTQHANLAQILRKIKYYLDGSPSQLHKHRMNIQQANPSNKRSHSILHQPQSFASFINSLQFITRLITEQMNSATDNPLVFSKQGNLNIYYIIIDGFDCDMLVSAGNFHGQYVAKASDFLGIALFNLGRFSQSRIQRYVNGRTSNNIPDFLTCHGGLNSGFMIAQYTSAALLSQSKVLVKPASVDTISTSASQEDHVSMGGFAARKAQMIYDNVAFILGIQFMCALQTIDLLGLKPSKKLLEIKEKARSSIKFMQNDRYYGPQITIAKNLVCKGIRNLQNIHYKN